jgi:serine/threonine protein phosphatase PrpC
MARHGVFVVADGMGGVDGGDFCSRLVVDRMAEVFETLDPENLSYEERLDKVEATILDASAAIYAEAQNRGISGMGTTVVALCFDLDSGEEACALHVGDSRAYRSRGRGLEALTVDHSMAAESGIRDGDMVPMFMAGVITRAVGVRPDVEVDRTPVDVRQGDRFLICSDGLYNMVPESRITMLLGNESQDPAADLVHAANEAGGFDNITVVLIEVLEGLRPSAGSFEETVN